MSTPAGFRSTLWTAMDAHARNRTSPRSGFPQTVPRQRRCPETVTTTRICSEPMGGQWAFVWKGSRSQDREPSLIRAVKTVVGCFRPRWTLPGLRSSPQNGVQIGWDSWESADAGHSRMHVNSICHLSWFPEDGTWYRFALHAVLRCLQPWGYYW